MTARTHARTHAGEAPATLVVQFSRIDRVDGDRVRAGSQLGESVRGLQPQRRRIEGSESAGRMDSGMGGVRAVVRFAGGVHGDPGAHRR